MYFILLKLIFYQGTQRIAIMLRRVALDPKYVFWYYCRIVSKFRSWFLFSLSICIGETALIICVFLFSPFFFKSNAENILKVYQIRRNKYGKVDYQINVLSSIAWNKTIQKEKWWQQYSFWIMYKNMSCLEKKTGNHYAWTLFIMLFHTINLLFNPDII